MRCHVPVLKNVPKGARGSFAGVLASCLRALMLYGRWDNLEALLLFPKFSLRVPASSRGGTGRRNSVADFVRRRCEEFATLPVPALWSLLESEASAGRPRRTRRGASNVGKDGDGEGLLRRMRSLAEEGAWGKAARQLSSAGLHDPNSSPVVERLRQLHPPDIAPLPGVSFVAPSSALCESDGAVSELLLAALRSFSPGSASGPSGLGPQHLQDLLKERDHVSVSACLGALAEFCAFCGAGDLPLRAARWLCVSRLVPLQKKDGGVRPIAVGETLRRLVAKFLSMHPETVAVGRGLHPVQLGVGASGACESLAIGMQEVLNHPPSSEPWVAVAVDISNAFNTLSRAAIVAGVKEFAPHLEPWTALTLGQETPLLLGESSIPSRRGTQQGDPLGPILFCLGIHRAVSSLPACGLWWNRWYFDDGCIVGPPLAVERAVSVLMPALARLGCEVNVTKSLVWGPGSSYIRSDSPRFPTLLSLAQVDFSPDSGLLVLGVPVHPPGQFAFVRSHLTTKVELLRDSCAKLRLLEDPQIQLGVLR